MRQKILFKSAFLLCVIMLFTGCGNQSQDADPNAGKDENGYITVAAAKAVVLENVGLLEKDVRFVRFILDSEGAEPRYEIEFISEDAEYDYTVNAVSGKILSMSCETGKYNIASVPPEIAPAADAQPTGASSQGSQATAAPSQGPQATAAPSQGSQAAAGQQYIGVEAAKQAALNHAGLNAADVRFAHAHLEYEHGYWTYDIEFHKDNTEYDYDINALTGEILSFDHDEEYRHHGTASGTGNEQITREKATQIALEYAGVNEADAKYLKVELDYDDGRAEYEVEWRIGQLEYTCDVDAYTGEVLSFEKEFD